MISEANNAIASNEEFDFNFFERFDDCTINHNSNAHEIANIKDNSNCKQASSGIKSCL